MSDTEGNPAHIVGQVTITPVGGGYYELHVGGRDPERVRGKENADTRAQEINMELTPPEGQMDAQPPLEVAAAAQAQSAQAQGAPTHVTISVEELDKLRMAAAAGLVATVQTLGGAAPAFDTTSVPNKFDKVLDDKQKRALGVTMTRIVLEDSQDIPPTGLFVSHNGRGYMIKAGEPVDVPDFILEILNHAVISLPVVDNRSGRVLGYRDRSKYPYRRVD